MVAPPEPDATPGESRDVQVTAGPGNRVQLRTAGLVTAAWVVVVAAYAAGVAAILPPLLVVAVAAVLRGGRTLLDRLMLAIGLLFGLTCVAGLVFAVWPWGLHPVAVAGTAFTVLIVAAAVTGRRPALPRPRIGDAIAAAAVGGVAAVLIRPVLRDGPAGRLARMLDGEDLARHTSVFDAIRRTGGYLFEQPEAAERLVYRGMVTYPQGSHLLAGLLDGFVRSSSGDLGSGTSMLTHYLAYVLGGYLLLTLALIWAAQWIGAAVLTPSRQLPVAAFVAGLCGFGPLLDMVRMGYPSQVAGLAAAVLLLALLVRPLAGARQQLVLVGLLLGAVGFTYYLYLPPVGLAVLVWLRRDRHRVLKHRAFAGVAAALAVVSAVPMATGVLLAGQGSVLFTAGAMGFDRTIMVVLGVVVGVSLLTRRARRSRVWRGYAMVFVPVAGFAGAMAAAQWFASGSGGYYASKALFLLFALLIAGVGAVLLHLPPPEPGRSAVPRWSAAVLVFLLVVGGFTAGPGDRRYQLTRHWAEARAVLETHARFTDDPVIPTVIVGDDEGYESYRMTLFLQTLQRTSGTMAAATYEHEPVSSPKRLDAVVARIPGSMRLVALSETAERRALAVRARHPELDIEVVRL
ncbi:hypothetical protein Drose_08710 [Dactylosporangium roseum]|uniref:Uncharacterized protein n=1 Tax=Dactylosporangium roseum TaxID=47989 RepID=A0ABY5ZDA7_9ACTN|nr:DUF1616 domain-containing protein [Dactylosporangium roseum]UWZ38309.1 hypothetical protein Drose_08710 [Dactylosporangium roseum]